MKKTTILKVAVSLATILPLLAACGGPVEVKPWDEDLKEGETAIESIKNGEVADGTLATVRGTVTALAGGTDSAGYSYYIQRHGFGYYVYGAKVSEAVEEVAIGNYIEVSGKTTSYNGLHELGTITSVKVIEAEGEKFTPVEVSDVSQLTAADSGKLVSFDKGLFYDGSITVGTASSVYVTVGSARVTLRTEKNVDTETQNQIKEAFDECEYRDFVNYAGPLGWYNGPQFALVEGIGLTVEDNPEPFDPEAEIDNAKLALTYPKLASDGVSANFALTTFSYGFNVTYTASTTTAGYDCLSISEDGKTLIVNAPVKPQPVSFVAGKLVATFNYGTESYGTKEFNVRINTIDPLTIQEITEYKDGKWTYNGKSGLTVSGYITAFYADYNIVTIQDGEYALNLYWADDDPSITVIGNLIRTTGEFTTYNDAPQLKNLTGYSLVEDSSIAIPVQIGTFTESEWAAFVPFTNNTSRYVEATMTYKSGTVANTGSHATIVMTFGSTDITVYLNYHNGVANMSVWQTLLAGATAGTTKFDVKGELGFYKSVPQILPMALNDFILHVAA